MRGNSGYQQPRGGFVSQVETAMTDRPDVPRATFNSRWSRKTAMDGSLLYPFLVDEILPGDHIQYDASVFLRMATPLFPLLDDMELQTFFFFVPARLCWTNWKKFMGEQNSPADSIAYLVPTVQLTIAGDPVGGIVDHMGIPVAGQVGGGNRLNPNVLPFRAYMLCVHEWFRDENLQDSWLPPLGDGPDTIGNYNPAGAINGLFMVNKKHDLFTSGLPWPQKFTAPTVPLGGQAWVKGIGVDLPVPVAGSVNVTESPAPPQVAYANTQAASAFLVNMSTGVNAAPQIYADLSTASGVAINTLRTAFMVQALLERDARGGTRYTELLTMHFGVHSPDARLQRPEYLGGGRSALNITAVAQTAPTTGVPLGTIGGAGTVVGRHGCSVAAVEHGYLLGLVCIRSELTYDQGMRRMWRRSTRYDFAWPSLVEMGEQTVLSGEIYADGSASDNNVFSYVPRFEEYRTRTSEAVGIMRARAAGTLAAWSLAENFSSRPTLGSSFVRDASRTILQRVQSAGASAVGQQFIGEWLISRRATRPLPAMAIPAKLGRF